MFKKKKIVIKAKKQETIKVLSLPNNPFFEKIQSFALKIKSNDKKFIFILLKYTEKSGASLRKGIITKIKETRQKKDFLLEYILLKVLYYMDIRGLKIVEAMYKAGLVTLKEYSILLKSRNFSSGIDQITNMEKSSSTLVIYNLTLLAPMYIMLVVLLATHGLIKDTLKGMVAPMVKAGGTPPPLPHYIEDISTYLFFNGIAWSILIALLSFYYYVKHYNIPLYFKIFKFNEQEIILEVLYNIESLTKSGINITDTVLILLESETNNVKREIYEQIHTAFIKGNIQLSTIFEYYNVNYQTIGLIATGEETGSIVTTLSLAYSSLKEMFTFNMKIYSKISFYGGQILMGMIIIKPIIDILLYTSIQQLNFSTN